MKTNRATQRKSPVSIPFASPSKASSRRSAGSSHIPISEDELADWMRKVKDLPDIRWDKVKAMREAIQSQTFETDDRLMNLADKLSPELMDYFRQIGQ